MMTKSGFCLALFAVAILIAGRSPAQALSCDNATTTRDMITCTQMDLNLADGDLNATYQELRSDLDKKGRLLLRDAQRAWIAFRDAECARQADIVRGGTMAPVLELSCLLSLTISRGNDLSRTPLTGETE